LTVGLEVGLGGISVAVSVTVDVGVIRSSTMTGSEVADGSSVGDGRTVAVIDAVPDNCFVAESVSVGDSAGVDAEELHTTEDIINNTISHKNE